MKISGTNSSELGLSILSKIKSLNGKTVDLKKIKDFDGPTIQHENWSILVDRYVADDGTVNYKAFKSEEPLLDSYLNKLSDNPPGKSWAKADKLSYWINAYNAFTIKLILNHYPVKSIKDIASGLPMINSPWDIKFFKIGGIDFDLNTIEHDILRKEFEEPRIHFAINCASFSCPKIRREAYTPENLEDQLEDQAKTFLENSNKNIISEQKTLISPIFSWFEGDFEKGQTISDFIERHHNHFNKDLPIKYMDYDWSLNE